MLGGPLQPRLLGIFAEAFHELPAVARPRSLQVIHRHTGFLVEYRPDMGGKTRHLGREVALHKGIGNLVKDGDVRHQISVIEPQVAVVGGIVAGCVLQVVHPLVRHSLRCELQLTGEVQNDIVVTFLFNRIKDVDDGAREE